jgi:hypothetical protein
MPVTQSQIRPARHFPQIPLTIAAWQKALAAERGMTRQTFDVHGNPSEESFRQHG